MDAVALMVILYAFRVLRRSPLVRREREIGRAPVDRTARGLDDCLPPGCLLADYLRWRQQQCRTQKEQAKFVFKRRYLIVKRREHLEGVGAEGPAHHTGVLAGTARPARIQRCLASAL